MRMAMTEPGHRDPAGEIQEFAAVGRVEIGALAPIDGNIPPAVSRHNCWYQGISPARLGWGKSVGTRTYRRRQCPTGAIHRTPPERRLSLPESRHRHSPRLGEAGAPTPTIKQESTGV